MKNENEREKLQFGFIPLWASKSISVGMVGLLLMQFTFYATDVVGLNAGIVGVLLLVSKLVDAAIGLVVGFLVDKTDTRLGKGRPYELFLIPVWICMVLLFSTPVNIGMTGKIIYVFAFYSLVNAVFMTLLGGGEAAYLGRAVHSDHQRAKVTSVSGVLVLLVCTLGAVILPQLIAAWGGSPTGWRMIAMTYAIPMSILGMLRFITIREKRDDSKQADKKVGVKEGVGLIFRNKYIFILAPAILLCNLTQTISSIVTIYYFTYIVGDLGMMSYISMLGLVTPLVLLLFPTAIKTIGGMNFVRIGLTLAAIGNLLKLFDLANIPLLVASQLLANTGLSTLTMMQGYFILQCIDYGERKLGKRVEGLSSAVSGLYSKLGAGLASVLIGGLMSMAGYVNLASSQTTAVTNTIVALYSWVPAILCVLMIITIHYYDLEKTYKK